MSILSRIFISCEEAQHICDKSQYNEASFWELIKLNIRLIHCGVCRNYSKNNGKLTKLMNDPSVECMKKKEKSRLKEVFNEELSNH